MATAAERPEMLASAQVPGVIDPTKNVLDLVRAESKYQDAMREQSDKFHTAMLEESLRRLDERDDLRERFEWRIAGMLAESVKSTSTLVSSQLVQIQSTFNERVAELERFRYESSGKTSVADPAMASAISALSASVDALKVAGERSTGSSVGRGQVIAYILAGIGALAAIGGFAFGLVSVLSAGSGAG